jgi:hypothetical protein
MRLEDYRRGMARAAALLIALVLTGCSASNPKMIELTAASNDAAVVLLYAIPTNVGYTIRIVGFDPVTQQAQDTLLNGWGEPMHVDQGTAPKFIVRRVTPGTYVYQSFSQQRSWAVCFHKDTITFTVKPGQVVFLGTFNPGPHIADLNKNVAANHNYTARDSDAHHYFDNITPPQVISPESNPEILAKAKAFVISSMPHVRADVQTASYSKTRFGAGHTLMGQRVCGGYFKEDPKQHTAGQ